MASVGVVVALLSAPGDAVAWWSHGHAHLTDAAIGFLPTPLRGVFEEHRDFLVSRSATEPAGSHWIHVDDYPSFLAGEFPRDYGEVVAMYGASYVSAQGTAPWTYASIVQSLTEGMASAQDPDDWFRQMRAAADQAHYIQDLHNPLHLTANYDGQLTGNHGIHARYEGEMVLRNLDQLAPAPHTAQHLPSVLDAVFDGIELHFPYRDDILAADDLHAGSPTEQYYEGLWDETGGFTQQLFQRAAEAVADGWYTAWVDAGSPLTFLTDSPDFNSDGVVDAADYTVWRDQLGQAGASLAADADGSQVVDQADYIIWRDNYGAATGAASAAPEPAAVGLAGLAFSLATSARRQRRR